MSGLVAGKKALILGVANKRSIAWGIAQALHREGAELFFNYQTERLKENVEELVESLGGGIEIFPMDVTNEEEIDALFRRVEEKWGKLDILVHSLAYAPREALEGRFVETTAEAWDTALSVSAYSLTATARRAKPLMEAAGGGSIITMSYLGAVRAVPSYNVMGVAKAALEASVRYLAADLGPSNIRVNAISAGPIKTLAAMGVKGLSTLLKMVEERAPLRRNVTQEDVGNAGVFLASDFGSAITGHVLYVDSGFHILGV